MYAAGFTLIETLVILAIVGLAGGVLAMGLQNRIPGLRLDAAAAAAEEELSARQSEAVLSGKEVDFSRAALNDTAQSAQSRRRLNRIRSVSVEIRGEDPTQPDRLRFLPGGWSPGGVLVLSDGNRDVVIRIDWPLGLIHRERRR